MADDDQEPPQGSPLRTLVALGLILALGAGMFFVVQQLRHAAAVQDCVASGRRNCVPIDGGR